MSEYKETDQQTGMVTASSGVAQRKQRGRARGVAFEDNRPETAQLRGVRPQSNRKAAGRPGLQAQGFNAGKQLKPQEPLQKKENRTGLPDELKAGVENLSGMAMDDVRVSYNSDKPAQLNAHAYTQGTEIHVAPGQEKHLPHEAWHVVQQKEGRVKSPVQMKGGVAVNDDVWLESEAEEMGVKAGEAGEALSGTPNGRTQERRDATPRGKSRRQNSNVAGGGPYQLSVLSKTQLNMVGEIHNGYTENRRKYEKEYTKCKTGKDEYHEEQDIYEVLDVEEALDKAYGDPRGLRLKWLVNNIRNKENEEYAEGYINALYKEVSMALDPGNGLMYKEIVPHKCWEGIEAGHRTFTNGGGQEDLVKALYVLFDEVSKAPEITGEEKGTDDLCMSRSTAMYRFANANSDRVCVWKVGQRHIDEIGGKYKGNQRRYKMINEEKWIDEVGKSSVIDIADVPTLHTISKMRPQSLFKPETAKSMRDLLGDLAKIDDCPETEILQIKLMSRIEVIRAMVKAFEWWSEKARDAYMADDILSSHVPRQKNGVEDAPHEYEEQMIDTQSPCSVYEIYRNNKRVMSGDNEKARTRAANWEDIYGQGIKTAIKKCVTQIEDD